MDIPAEPETWILVFTADSPFWWVKLLACGRYNHVKACGYVRATDSWLFYDVGFQRTQLACLPNTPVSDAFIADFTRGADLMAFPRRDCARRRIHPGLWCVVAIKHLIGLHSGALRPSRLWDDCLAAGGEPLRGQ